MGRATQGVRLINLEKRNDQIGSVCKVASESTENEVPAEETEGSIISDPNVDIVDDNAAEGSADNAQENEENQE
jgi:DNA gyrase subunit A